MGQMTITAYTDGSFGREYKPVLELFVGNEIYGDPLLVGEVVQFNNFSGYRNVSVGTEILLPMLKKR